MQIKTCTVEGRKASRVLKVADKAKGGPIFTKTSTYSKLNSTSKLKFTDLQKQLEILLKAKDMHHMLRAVLPIHKLLKQPQCTNHAKGNIKGSKNRSVNTLESKKQETTQEHLHFVPLHELLFHLSILVLVKTIQANQTFWYWLSPFAVYL